MYSPEHVDFSTSKSGVPSPGVCEPRWARPPGTRLDSWSTISILCFLVDTCLKNAPYCWWECFLRSENLFQISSLWKVFLVISFCGRHPFFSRFFVGSDGPHGRCTALRKLKKAFQGLYKELPLFTRFFCRPFVGGPIFFTFFFLLSGSVSLPFLKFAVCKQKL